MTENLTELMLNMNDNERHDIKNRLCFHIGELTLDCYENRKQVIQIKSQYHSLVQQYFKPYEDNTYKENVLVSMDKAYNKMKLDYKNE